MLARDEDSDAQTFSVNGVCDGRGIKLMNISVVQCRIHVLNDVVYCLVMRCISRQHATKRDLNVGGST